MGELDNHSFFSGHWRRRVPDEIYTLGLMAKNRLTWPPHPGRPRQGRLRRLAEIASRGVVLRRRLPSRFGGRTLYVSPECGLRYWQFDLGKVDPVLLGMAERYVRAGDVVWDIGANVGLFTFAAAYRAARVLAFEPDPWLADLLERTAASFPNVSIIRAAVADYCGEGELHIAVRARGSNFLLGNGSSQSGGTRCLQPIRVLTLDSLDQPPPDLLKIDVEAGELAVLRGAARLLADRRPAVICEVAEENASAVTACLGGYTLFDAERGIQVNTAVWSTVAVAASAVGSSPLDVAAAGR